MRSSRAQAAADAVERRFGTTLYWYGLPLPCTRLLIDETTSPATAPLNYWWQAHHVDALVDMSLRHAACGRRFAAWRARRRAVEALRTVRARNGWRWENDYYDDMAWLALAAGRLDALAPSRLAREAQQALAPEFDLAHSDQWGGGCFWSKQHDFKNAPASVPIALWWARQGDVERASGIADWVASFLVDPATGLVRDGVRDDTAPCHDDAAIWTYNQGTYLGLLVELGRVDEAIALIRAVDENLRVGSTVLRCDGTGDRGLFTGILVRYLTQAALDPRLPEDVRWRCEALVLGTADALWNGRDRDTTVFSPDPSRPAADVHAGGTPLGVTPQLQAWTIFEAAATLSRRRS